MEILPVIVVPGTIFTYPTLLSEVLEKKRTQSSSIVGSPITDNTKGSIPPVRFITINMNPPHTCRAIPDHCLPSNSILKCIEKYCQINRYLQQAEIIFKNMQQTVFAEICTLINNPIPFSTFPGIAPGNLVKCGHPRIGKRGGSMSGHFRTAVCRAASATARRPAAE
jgi:hypothetical protein